MMEEVKSFPLVQKTKMNNSGIVIFYMHIVKGNVQNLGLFYSEQ